MLGKISFLVGVRSNVVVEEEELLFFIHFFYLSLFVACLSVSLTSLRRSCSISLMMSSDVW